MLWLKRCCVHIVIKPSPLAFSQAILVARVVLREVASEASPDLRLNVEHLEKMVKRVGGHQKNNDLMGSNRLKLSGCSTPSYDCEVVGVVTPFVCFAEESPYTFQNDSR